MDIMLEIKNTIKFLFTKLPKKDKLSKNDEFLIKDSGLSKSTQTVIKRTSIQAIKEYVLKNVVHSWSTIPSDDNIPSEKLVKDYIDSLPTCPPTPDTDARYETSFTANEWLDDPITNLKYIEFEHNLNTLTPIIAVWDDLDQLVILHDVKVINITTLRIYVTDTEEFDGRLLLLAPPAASSYTITFTTNDWLYDSILHLNYIEAIHNLNSTAPVMSVWSIYNYLVIPHDSKIINSNVLRIYITDTEEFSGRMIIKR